MTQARVKIDANVHRLGRSDLERLIYEANLGKETDEIAHRYFIDRQCQIDIAADMMMERSTVSRRLTGAKRRIVQVYYDRLTH